jgi:Zn-dependent hydrolases, including glyoxylases
MTHAFTRIALAALLAAPLLAAPVRARTQDNGAHTPAKLASACAGRDGWADPAPPAHVFANVWYVGTCGITVLLVTSKDGHVLLDGGPAEAAPLVLANIAALGFKPGDVRWILSSHEHHDHVGALAALQRATKAKVAVLRAAGPVMKTGKPLASDPQAGLIEGFDPVAVDRLLDDGDSVIVGGSAFTVHATPAHSPGSASWTWQSCTPDFTCRMIAYADSATAISADDYRFTDHADRIAAVRKGVARIAAMPCDILLTPHPGASDMMERFSGDAPLVDPAACKAYAAAAGKRFDDRLKQEAGKRP